MEYASGIFLSILAVAALVNLRRGTLGDWIRAKFLNLAPGEVIAPTAPEPSAPAKALSKGLTPASPGAGGGDASGSKIKVIKAAVGRQFAADIAAGNLDITGGVTACRPMKPQPRGISHVAYSEHAWSNAWDLYYRGKPRKYVNAVVRWLRKEKAAGRLPVGSIITYGPRGSHVHIEGSPKQNPRPYRNVPPCAR